MSLKSTYKPSWLAKLLGQASPECLSVSVALDKISIEGGGKNQDICFNQMGPIKKGSKWFWHSARFSMSTGWYFSITGMSLSSREKMVREIIHNQDTMIASLTLLRAKEHLVFNLWDNLNDFEEGNYWMAQNDVQSAIESKKSIHIFFEAPTEYVRQFDTISEKLLLLRRFYRSPSSFKRNANDKFKLLEKVKYKEYFDSIEENPLTERQRLAVITHEDNTLVVAGAGSGKTSVIVSKVGYLLKKGLCKSKEILAIAYNRGAADSLNDRIVSRTKNEEVKSSTFHALGLSIVANVEGKKPSLSPYVESSRRLESHIEGILASLVREEKPRLVISEYFQSYFAPYKSEFDFETKGDYYKWVKDNSLLTFTGQVVRSYEELEIANFLYLHGVSFEYERLYEVDTATEKHSQYRPDFYLPEYEIYIEHFGVSRDGDTASYVNKEEYHQGMNWKRGVHAKNKTKLLETYSYEKQENKLLVNLADKLIGLGVEISPISTEKILEVLNNSTLAKPLTKLVVTFLSHFKGGLYTIDKVKQQAESRKMSDDRFVSFLDLFELVYERYEKELKQTGHIDFDDMVNKAVQYVKSKEYISPYKSILVDEFQDISTNRAELVMSLRNQSNSHRLFCVGDDWQSIYRFTGSDISYMRDFDKIFGFTEEVVLDKTFRYNSKIEEVATKFILANPMQLNKDITAVKTATSPNVFVTKPSGKGTDVFLEMVGEIAKRSSGRPTTVLCLGRYNFNQNGLSWNEAIHLYKNIKIEFKTVHGAKGLEADYVILLGLGSGKYGFPSEMVDDPIIETVLAVPENFAHAEERRLFYVALTRAKNAVYMATEYSSQSSFVLELLEFEGLVDVNDGVSAAIANCPDCETGTLVRRESEHGVFYSCGYYPLCAYKVNACVQCRDGLLSYVETSGRYDCGNQGCSHSELPCPNPDCIGGRLVERNGKYGAFLGCTNYQSRKCEHTRNID